MNPFSLFGSPLMMYNIAKDPMPTNSVGDLQALQKAFAAAHEKNRLKGPPVQGLDLPQGFIPHPQVPYQSPTSTPPSPFASAANNIVAQNNQPSVPLGLPQTLPTKPMPPVQPTGFDVPMAPQAMGGGIPMPQPRPQVPLPPQATAQASVPMPMARPPQAPQAPSAPSGGMGFFQRNAAMMRDPVTGDFIDPVNAQRAEQNISGPKLVQKFMNYLHKETS